MKTTQQSHSWWFERILKIGDGFFQGERSIPLPEREQTCAPSLLFTQYKVHYDLIIELTDFLPGPYNF